MATQTAEFGFNDLLDQTETKAKALVLEADKAIALLDSVDAMIDNRAVGK